MLEANSEINVAEIEKMIDVLKANKDIGIDPDVVNHLEKAVSIIEPYQFDMDGWIDRCLIPDVATTAFELFKQTCGAFQMELNKAQFLLQNNGWEADSIKAAIKRIEYFIDRTHGKSYESACAALVSMDVDSEESWMLEYLRLTGKIYKVIGMKEIGLFSVRSIIYGKYVLFYEFLNQKLKETETTKNPATSKHNSLYTQRQIALYYYYLHEVGIKDRFDLHISGKIRAIEEIIALHSLNSVKSFQQHYNKISNYKSGAAERTGSSVSNINDLKQVIVLLQEHPEALKLAQIDLLKAEK